MDNNSNNNNNNNNSNNSVKVKNTASNSNSVKTSAMDLEKLQMEYNSQLTEYQQAVANYVSYLQQNAGQSYIIIGIGMSGDLWSRQGLNGAWNLINDNSDGCQGICTMNDGKGLLGIVGDNIYTKTNYTSNWTGPIQNPCCVTSVAMGQDGTVVGVGTNNVLWSKPNLNGTWAETSSPGEWVSSVAIAPDGSIFVIGEDEQIWKKNSYQDLPSQSWISQGVGGVIAITIAPDGTFIGVGNDNQIYTQPNYNNLTTSWQGPYSSQNSSCCVTGITTVINSEMTSIPGNVFWGSGQSGTQSVYTGGTLEQCQALCSSTTNCSGATFNPTAHGQPMCWLRSGEGQLAPGLDTDTAIIPQGQEYLLTINSINNKLIETNEKIQNIIDQSEPEYNSIQTKNEEKNKELIQNYVQLTDEREKIAKMIKKYEDLDESQIQGELKINQKYYTYILLVLVVIGTVVLLYKFSNVFTQDQSSESSVQTGGELSENSSVFLLIIIVVILIANYYTTIASTTTNIGNTTFNGFASIFSNINNFFSLRDNY